MRWLTKIASKIWLTKIASHKTFQNYTLILIPSLIGEPLLKKRGFESKNGKSQILTGIENLGIKTFYQKEEEAKSRNRIFIRSFSSLLGLFPHF